MLFSARSGEKPSLQMKDADGTLALAQAAVPAARAQHAPATEESVRKQLTKLGDTPYSVETLQIDLEPDLFLPVSVLNTLRRDCAGSYPRCALQNAPLPRRYTCDIQKKREPRQRAASRFSSIRPNAFFPFDEDDVPEALRPIPKRARAPFTFPWSLFMIRLPTS